MQKAADNPGVIAPPPLIAAGVLLLGLLLDWLFPVYVISIVFSLTARIVVGIPLIAAGLALVVLANVRFRVAGTNVAPWMPSLALVDDGVFGWLRNPMYVGGMLVLIGLGIALAGDWIVVLAILAGFVLHYGVVLREERYLEGKFGDAYRRYKQRVPRYGWPV